MSTSIHFVTGKGGTGKSTIASALALKFARSGAKTLLVELSENSHLSEVFAVSDLSLSPQKYEKNLDLALWTGAGCLREYANHILKVESLVRLFFENRVTKSLIEIAPALKEIAVLGKITSGVRRHGPAAPHDVIVIDAPSTGHFLSLLRAPRGLAEITQRGPIGEQSRSIERVLREEKICKYHIVTLPEEMPIQECLELTSALRSEFEIQPQVILNQVLPEFELAKAQSLFAQQTLIRLNLQKKMELLLQKQNVRPQKVPLVLKSNEIEIVKSCEAFL